jgi:hypothetical protein
MHPTLVSQGCKRKPVCPPDPKTGVPLACLFPAARRLPKSLSSARGRDQDGRMGMLLESVGMAWLPGKE